MAETPGATSRAPFLARWFAIMDSDSASDVLDLISDDFRLSIVFSTSPGEAQDFSGDRDALVVYLKQRERGTRTHHELAASASDGSELFLGEVRRGGVFEASFVAAGRIGGSGRLERLLISRSPAVRFTD